MCHFDPDLACRQTGSSGEKSESSKISQSGSIEMTCVKFIIVN
jgi:hypothetical protein